MDDHVFDARRLKKFERWYVLENDAVKECEMTPMKQNAMQREQEKTKQEYPVHIDYFGGYPSQSCNPEYAPGAEEKDYQER